MISPKASAADGNGKAGSRDDDSVVLGDFETGLDGWTTNGGNTLNRLSEDDVPAGVVSGQHGLAVEIDGDLHPMIENEKRVMDADFANHPYLGLHVLAQAEATDSDLVFKFRLHHTATGDDGPSRNSSNRSKDENVAESELKTVPQLRPNRLQWDASEFPEEVLETANRLEIVWYLDDHEPDRGHRGRSNENFDYQGVVVFDDIRLFESAPVNETRRRQQKKVNLHREHGMIVKRVFEERTEGLERGTLVFVDGTEVPYSFEVLGDGQFEYTLDGETFKPGGGPE